MGKYGLRLMEPSHVGYLGKPRAVKWVKALMRGLHPILSEGD